MPLDLDVVNAGVRSAIATILGVDLNTVRQANKNGPTGKINEPFITVLVSEVNREGWDEVTYSDNNVAGELLETTSGLRAVICSIQCFRAGAYTRSIRLESLLQGSNAIYQLGSAGLMIKRIGKSINLSQEVDTLFEERAQLELELYVSAVEQATVSTFAGVTITVQSETTEVTNEVNLDVAP